MRKFLIKVLPVILLLILCFWVGKGLFKYDVNYTQDLRRHLGRSYDAVITISEGSFPLRWAGILNYECGVPMYNFYNPLLYYLAVLLYLFTGHLLLSLKIINLMTLIVGTVFFYFWIKEETKNKLASFAGAIVYLFAPYTFLLIYVRGSPEYLSYAILPIVLFLYAKTFGKKEYKDFVKYAFFAALAGGFLVISHNLAALLSLTVLVAYTSAKLIVIRSSSHTKVILFSLLSIIGFAAFFIFPAIFEKGFTKLDTPIFEYKDHFPTLEQLFNSKWGYGDSAIGTRDDGMSFQLGYAQWLVLGIGLIWAVLSIRRIRRIRESTKLLPLLFLVLAILFLFLILPVSIPVWDKVGILQTFQFSWRLLGICAFTISAFFAFMIAGIKARFVRTIILIGVAVLAIVGNRNHLLPQPVYENDLQFYQDLDVIGNKRRFLGDFSDTVLAHSAKVSCYLTTPLAETNKRKSVKATELSRGSTHGRVRLDLDETYDDKVVLNLSYFPEIFDLKLNGKKVGYSDCEGRVCIDVSEFQKGDNEISWRVGQTRVEKIFNIVTLVFLGVWVFMLLKVISKK